jgi:hypothetical protein
MRLRNAIVSPVVAAAAVVGGCGGGGGGGEDDVKNVVKTYFSALAEADGPRACSQLNDAEQHLVLEQVQTRAPKVGAKTCADAVTAIGEQLPDSGKQALRNAQFEEVSINGDSATVKIKGATSDATLTKSGDRWLISGGLFE